MTKVRVFPGMANLPALCSFFPVPQICLHQCCEEGQAEIQSCEGSIFRARDSWRNRCSKCSFRSLSSALGQNWPGHGGLTLGQLLICCSSEWTALQRGCGGPQCSGWVANEGYVASGEALGIVGRYNTYQFTQDPCGA